VVILLDENLPLQLYDRLRAVGANVEHIIVLGQRGLPDRDIRARLRSESIVLLTQDTEFEDVSAEIRGKVIVSRVRQSLPIRTRVAIWCRALSGFVRADPDGHLFELLESGEVVPLARH
jgi:predicted nuclease of predicted toxin-antitoxin system